MRVPTHFLCHGGGPWPWMQGPLRRILSELERGLLNVPAQWPTRPTAILVISAHWEERAFTVTTAEAPGMVYDYTGFPPEMYAIRYACPGSPSLAARVVHLLRAAGLPAAGSDTRGYDHGTYSVLQTMVPTADIPVVQLSMRHLLDPDEHLQAGRALATLRDEGVLIIGSGMSCHERGPDMAVPSAAFDDWLRRVVCDQYVVARRQSLRMWERAPYARIVHPREDHLLPLMVAAGAGWDDPAHCVLPRPADGLCQRFQLPLWRSHLRWSSMMNDSRSPAPGQAAPSGDGVVSRLLTPFLFRSAVVADNRELAPGLRLIDEGRTGGQPINGKAESLEFPP